MDSLNMSIMRNNQHVPKRRKLSHSSDDRDQTQRQTSNNGMGTPGIPEVGDKAGNLVQGPQAAPRNKIGSPMVKTDGTTKSSLMQLQIRELLEETRPDYDHYLKEIRPVCDRLIQTIKAIPDCAPSSLVEAEKTLHKQSNVAIPFAGYRPDSDVKYKFQYKRPERITLRGGLIQQLSTNHEASVEIAVQMPSELFQEKDYLNYRVFHKRAYYTACLAAGLKDSLGEEFSYNFHLQDGNDLVPVILLRHSQEKSSKVLARTQIIVSAVFPGDIGTVEKLLPTRNCLRGNYDSQNGNGNLARPTPFYNSTICLLDSLPTVDQLIAQVAQKCDAFRDACSLGEIWLRQRGFTSHISAGGFGQSEWTYMCALLLIGGGHKGHPLFSDRYNSMQLFKAMLQVLASRDLNEPFLVRAPDVQLPNSDLQLLYDGLTGVNVLFKMSRWSYDLLRHQAQLSLTAVNTRAHENFESTFIARVEEPNLQFDEIYTIKMVDSPDFHSKRLHDTVTKLHSVLRKGFGDRVRSLYIKPRLLDSWPLTKTEPKRTEREQTAEVRLLINPEAVTRLIDQGPTAEQQEEAREFRTFWGEKSELRRFRDGSITETLVWSIDSPVTLQIIQYLAIRHLNITPSSIKSVTQDFQHDFLSSSVPMSSEDAFKVINTKYQELSSRLHQLEGLPLPIRSVSPVGQSLRSASMGHPLDSATSAPIDILIQFESSARWPDHPLAIQHTKIAFLAKISDLVQRSDSSLSTRIGLENANSTNNGHDNTSFLDVMISSPAPGLSAIVFRLRIHHDHEQQIIQNRLADKSLAQSSRESVSSALLEHKRMFVASSVHTNTLRNLITHFPPLSTTIRLLKYWFASHNLSNHFLDPVLEIIAAHVFLRPYPWSTPGNSTTAFLRCLYFLSRWDWASSPLIVNLSLSEDMTDAQMTESDTRFQAWRKLDPNMNTVTWFVGTNIDSSGTIWTQGAKPARVVAGRVTALATAAMELIRLKTDYPSDENWRNLFVSPTGDYDFVVYLKPSVVRGRKKGGRKHGEIKFKNLQVQEDLDVDSICHDPVLLYLNDLEKAFTNTVLFFYGEQGTYIAGLWRPNVVGIKDWRVRLGYSSIPYAGRVKDGEVDSTGAAEINRQGILAEIALLGEGMIEKITVKK